ncbi:hypothetical protein [Streptomyces sp. NPDC051561]|uniref:hypothetical protein n=1 Tax=Streptomyces sp. NPDC051561 TaxID=3365658 RepID=UPI0037AD0A3E
MSDDISKASAEAVAAARQSEQFAMMLAAMEAARAVQPPTCQHQAPAPKSSGSAGKWLAVGVGGSVFMVALALSAVAVAISAVALTVCLLVLRSVWQDIQKGRD